MASRSDSEKATARSARRQEALADIVEPGRGQQLSTLLVLEGQMVGQPAGQTDHPIGVLGSRRLVRGQHHPQPLRGLRDAPALCRVGHGSRRCPRPIARKRFRSPAGGYGTAMTDDPRKEQPDTPTAHPGGGGTHRPDQEPAPEPDGETLAPDVDDD